MSATTFVRMPSTRAMLLMGEPDLPIEAFGGLKPIPRAIGRAGMTLHKGGGGLKAVVGVVAAIAIPFVAPAVAGAIATSTGISAATFGLSATVGATLGSAIVGAGLGAVTAAVTGGDVGRGALFGGIGGGISGYMDATSAAAQASGTGLTVPATTTAPPVTGTEGLTGTGTSIATGAPGVDFGPVDYSLTGGQTFTNVGLRAPTGGIDLGTTLSSSSAGTGIDLASAGTSGAGASTSWTPPDYSLAGSSASTTAAGAGQYASTSWTPPDYSLAGSSASTTTAGAAGTGQYASTSWTPPDYSLTGGAQAATLGSSAAGASQTAGAAAGASQTAGAATSRWGKFSDALKAKLTNPEAQADMVLRAAGQLAGSMIAGNGLSDEEKQLLAQQKQELEQLRSTNQELFNQRLQEAQNLLGESRYFDPEYFGGQSYKAYQTAAGRAERDVLRGIGPQRAGLRTAEERRFALQRSAGGQTAYLQGADMAQQNKLRTQQAGLNAIPTSGPTAALSYGNYIGQLYDAADRRRRQTAGDIGNLFGSFTGTPMANKA